MCYGRGFVAKWDAMEAAVAWKKFRHLGLTPYDKKPPEPLKTVIENQALAFTVYGFPPHADQLIEQTCITQCRISKTAIEGKFTWNWKPYAVNKVAGE